MKSIWILLLLPVMAAAQKPKDLKLKGNLQLTKPVEQLLISYRNGDNTVNDSLKPVNGSFTYKSKIAEPLLANFRVKYAKQPGEERAKMEAIALFLEPGTMSISAKDSLKNNTVKGSDAHEDYRKLVEMQKSYNSSLEQLYQDWSRYGKEKNKEAQS